MGTIQPSRFLSHTGRILPGVRRVFTIPQPAAGSGFSFTVPGGVQWWIIQGNFKLDADATVANRQVYADVTVDGLLVSQTAAGVNQPASTIYTYGVASTYSFAELNAQASNQVITLPNGNLPEGAIVAVGAVGLDANDQFSACNLWIEEVYVTDPQLSEIARVRAELERDEAIYEYEQATQGQQGA